jgi:hypothetical protein
VTVKAKGESLVGSQGIPRGEEALSISAKDEEKSASAVPGMDEDERSRIGNAQSSPKMSTEPSENLVPSYQIHPPV